MADQPFPLYPDRPFDCSECKKTVAVIYTEIVGTTITKTSLCADCPELERRLHGTKFSSTTLHEHETGLCCGECGTSWETIQKGGSFGCMECYEIFGDAILPELVAIQKVSPTIVKKKKGLPIHTGRILGETTELDPSLRLLALNEALKETLSREDYEQAAWLRDQINELTGKADEEKKS